MAKEWYDAVCDKCGEARAVFVNSPTCTAAYLSKDDQKIFDWLKEHYSCELRFIHRDDQMDKLWNEGYALADKDGIYRRKEIKNDKSGESI